MIIKTFWVLLLVLSSGTLFSSDSLGTFSFVYVSPVKHDIKLSGNFMELRSNHFHTGIDIKSSRGVPGDDILAVADGRISRIRVSAGGYGNTLYVDHPNNTTSVYAHLNIFRPEIEHYLDSIQYMLHSFEVDIYITDSLFTLRQGEKIGEMGNTGRSFGPHLHFELRQTDTEEPLNPQAYGLGPQDSRRPIMECLYFFELDDNGVELTRNKYYFKSKGDNYSLHQSIRTSARQVALGIDAHDLMNGTYNKNGIYAYRVYYGDSIVMHWKADKTSFDYSRYINGFWDYKEWYHNSNKVYLLYRKSCNEFPYFGDHELNGIIELKSSRERLRVELFDLSGNVSSLDIDIILENNNYNDKEISDDLSCDSIQSFRGNWTRIDVPSEALFEPMDITFTERYTIIDGVDVQTSVIGREDTPLKNKIRLSVQLPDSIDDNSKFCLLKRSKKGVWKNHGGRVHNDRIELMTYELGAYVLARDIVAPSIHVLNWSRSKIRFRISDNWIPTGSSPELKYWTEVNDKWVKMNYDLKSNTLTLDRNMQLKSGDKFSLMVVDNCDNVSYYNKIMN